MTVVMFMQSVLSGIIGFVILATILIIVLLIVLTFCLRKSKKYKFILSIVFLVGGLTIYKSSTCLYDLVRLQKEVKRIDTTIQDIKSKLSNVGNL